VKRVKLLKAVNSATKAPTRCHLSVTWLSPGGCRALRSRSSLTLPRAELGRASWKLLHTTLSRYPVSPTPDEREALNTYLHLFARLYPCGECAGHFQKLLKKFPPQTSSRDAASQWGCYVHNLVNERLGKKEFECRLVMEHYKCGCAEEDGKDAKAATGELKGKKERATTVAMKEKEKGFEERKPIDKLEENVKKAGNRVEIERGP
jgi:hypothetical protein